jgi:hypothetical protein
MNYSNVIIVNGLPCTGKTTIANYLSKILSIPVAGKDTFKELLFDTLGWEDRSWSKKLDIPSMKLVYQFISLHADVHRDCIVENPFSAAEDSTKLLDLQKKYALKYLEIICFADGATLVDRFKSRAEAGNRHPGHCDHLTYQEHIPILMQGKILAMNIGDKLEVDTTDFSRVNFQQLVNKISGFMS